MAVARMVPPVVNSTNRVAADFLRIDSEVALTLSGIALAATDEATRRHTTMVARRAYDTIARLKERIELTGAERDKLDANLQRVKTELQSLGQIL
jgi:septal ring factor EnvC (AmiA/AmiB activator)